MNGKRMFVGFIVMISLILYGCGGKSVSDEDLLTVAVSIPPQQTFVEKVAGDLVEVVTMIPPGYTPENYQASPQDMVELSKASIYFAIGVETEDAGLLERAMDLNPNMIVVEQDEVVDQVYPPIYYESDGIELADSSEEEQDEDEHDEHSHEGRDAHIWMSPKRVKVLVENICQELCALDPDNQETYQKNADAYLQELDDLDEGIAAAMEDVQCKTFLIYHPSMGYFAQDYGLTMVAIESEGKEATASRLRSIIDFSMEQGIKVVFYQQEHDKSQAEAIAAELGGEVMELAPLDPDYVENMQKIKDLFTQVLK